MQESSNPQPEDLASQAERLLDASGKRHKLLTQDDIDDATKFGKMSVAAKLEVYSARLIRQLTGERNRLAKRVDKLDCDCEDLRSADKELAALKRSICRDRWEMAIAVAAMAAGGGLISSGPVGSTPFACGWTLLGFAGVWQFGKTIWVSGFDQIYDAYRTYRGRKSDSQ